MKSLTKNELNTLVKELSDTIQSKDCEIEKLKNELDDMSHKLQDAQTKIKELETTVEKEKSWGTKTWDNTSSWGTQNTTIEEEKHGKEQTHHNQKSLFIMAFCNIL